MSHCVYLIAYLLLKRYLQVGEEGIGIDSASESEGSNMDKSLVAEAKPVGKKFDDLIESLI